MTAAPPAPYNLVCPAGHRHRSPDPGEWIDHSCGYPTARRVDGLPTVRGSCTLPLRPLFVTIPQDEPGGSFSGST